MKYKLINGWSALDVNALTWNPVYISYNFVIFLTRIDYPWLTLPPYLSGDFNFILKCLITFIAFLWQFEFRDFFICTEISQANGGNDIEEAVITAPLHFSNEQKTEIRWINQLLISRSKIEVLKLYGIRRRAHIHIHCNCLDFMLWLYNFTCIM